MSDAIKGKQLVERYNRFVEYSKERKKGKQEPFDKRLADLTQERPTEEKPRHQEPARSARRYQPPRLARPKAITTQQAQRLSHLAPLIQNAARRNNVPVELICGVILQESGGNHLAKSPVGAMGLMQLMPQTAKRFGVQNAYDPRQNIEAGTKYLRWLLDRFDNNIELALAGYNAGEGNVEKYHNKVPPFAETRAYIPNVLGYTQSMIDIFYAKSTEKLPSYARRV